MGGSRIPPDVYGMACEAVRPLQCEAIPDPQGEGFELRVWGEPLPAPLTFRVARIATLHPTRYIWFLQDVREVLRSHGCALAEWPAGSAASAARDAGTGSLRMQ